MNAKEAREKATSIKNGINSAQYKKVMEKIEEAVKKGQLSVSYYSSLTHTVIQQLKSEGYEVISHYDQRDGTTININW
jgi:chorismate mutase